MSEDNSPGIRFTDAYEVIFTYSFEKDETPPRSYIGDREDRFCRFCREPDARFRGDSHVIPAGLGNRSLFSLEECHECNDPWGSDIEDSLAKYLFLTRAVSRIRKRKGGVKYKRAPNSTSTVSSSPTDNLVRVEIDELDDSVRIEDLGEGLLRLSATGQPFSPMKAAKALARLGLFVVPRLELGQVDHVRRWLRGELEYKPYFLRIFVPGTGRRLVRLRAYRHIGTSADAAPYVVHLTYGPVDLILPLPTASLQQPSLPRAPFPGLSPFPPHLPVATRVDVLAEGVVSDAESSFTLRYQGKHELTEMHYVSEKPAAPKTLSATDLPAEIWEADASGPVEFLVSSRAGEVLYRSGAEMKLLRGEDDSVSVELRGQHVDWTLRLPLGTQGQVDFQVPGEAGVPVADAIEAFKFRRSLCLGAVIEARDVHDHAPIFYGEYNPAPCDFEELEGLARLYDRLAIIEAEFPTRLTMPDRVEPAEVRSIEFASSAIELGEFVDAPAATYEVPMNARSVDYLEAEFADGRSPEGLQAPLHGLIRLFGEDLDLGPWHVCLERPQLQAGVEDIVAELREVADHEVVFVPMAADRCVLRFQRYLSSESDAQE